MLDRDANAAKQFVKFEEEIRKVVEKLGLHLFECPLEDTTTEGEISHGKIMKIEESPDLVGKIISLQDKALTDLLKIVSTDEMDNLCKLLKEFQANINKYGKKEGVSYKLTKETIEWQRIEGLYQQYDEIIRIAQNERDIREIATSFVYDPRYSINKVNENLRESLQRELHNVQLQSKENTLIQERRRQYLELINRYQTLSLALRECEQYVKNHEGVDQKVIKINEIKALITPESLGTSGSEAVLKTVRKKVTDQQTQRTLNTHRDFRKNNILRILLTILTLPTIIIPLALWKKPKSGQVLDRLKNNFDEYKARVIGLSTGSR